MNSIKTVRLYHFNNSLTDEAGQFDATGTGYSFINSNTLTPFGYGIHILPGTALNLGTLNLNSEESFTIDFWLYIYENTAKLSESDPIPWYFQLYERFEKQAIGFCSESSTTSIQNIQGYEATNINIQTFPMIQNITNTSHHCVIQYNSTRKSLQYYMDGKLLGKMDDFSLTTSNNWYIYLGIDLSSTSDITKSGANFIISDLRIVLGETLYYATDTYDISYVPHHYPYTLTTHMKRDIVRLIARKDGLFDACNNVWDQGDLSIVKGGKFNTYAIELNNNTIGAKVLYNLMNNGIADTEYTISMWVYLTAYPHKSFIFSFGDFNVDLSTAEYTITQSVSFSLDNWVHIAIIGYQNKVRMFFDGELVGTYNGTIPFTLSDFKIGYPANNGSVVTGKIDDLYITNKAIWTTTKFDVPTKAFTVEPSSTFDDYQINNVGFNNESDIGRIFGNNIKKALIPHNYSIYTGCFHNATLSFDLSKEWLVGFEWKFAKNDLDNNWNILFAFGSHSSYDSTGSAKFGLNTYGLINDDNLGSINPGTDWHKYIMYFNPISGYIYIFKDGYFLQNISITELNELQISGCYIGGGDTSIIYGYLKNLILYGNINTNSNISLIANYIGKSLNNDANNGIDFIGTNSEPHVENDLVPLEISSKNALYVKAAQWSLNSGYLQLGKIFVFGESQFHINCWCTIEPESEEWASIFSINHDQFNMMKLYLKPYPDINNISTWYLKLDIIVNGITYEFAPSRAYVKGNPTRTFHILIDYDYSTKTIEVNMDEGNTNEVSATKTINFPINMAYSVLFGASYDRVFLKSGNFKGNIDEFSIYSGERVYEVPERLIVY